MERSYLGRVVEGRRVAPTSGEVGAMSRKNPTTWFGWMKTCPTCGGFFYVSVRRGGIVRVPGKRHSGGASVRVYGWPVEVRPRRVVARCPDAWHETHTRLGYERAVTPERADYYRYQRATRGVVAQRRADAMTRRKAKARRHKEGQAKR